MKHVFTLPTLSEDPTDMRRFDVVEVDDADGRYTVVVFPGENVVEIRDYGVPRNERPPFVTSQKVIKFPWSKVMKYEMSRG